MAGTARPGQGHTLGGTNYPFPDRDILPELLQRARKSGAMPKREPDLSRKLARTIKPSGGPAAQLETLADVAQLIADLDLGKRHKRDSRVLVWDQCAGEILKAATTGKKADIAEATRCLEVALDPLVPEAVAMKQAQKTWPNATLCDDGGYRIRPCESGRR